MIFVIGWSVLLLLAVATAFALRKLGAGRRDVYVLFLLVLLLHAPFALFAFYADFQPFSGGSGDYIQYDRAAQEVAERVLQGNFSLEGVWLPNYFPVLVGYLYAATLSSMLVGQLLNVWLAAVSVLLLYVLTLEGGASRAWAFFVGAGATVYPSFLFFTSYLLKDALVIVITLAALLVGLRLLKGFSWKALLLFFFFLVLLIHLRVYMGYILMIAFLLSWFFLAATPLRKRLAATFLVVPLLGFAPVIVDAFPFLNIPSHGYYGMEDFKRLANPQTIEYYRKAYLPAIGKRENSTVEGMGIVEGGASALLGPFPWHFTAPRHAVSLGETVPWFLVLSLVILGMWRRFRRNPRDPAFLLLLFALGVIAELALFVNNFGIAMRIRIPAFLVLMTFLPFALYPPWLGRLLERVSQKFQGLIGPS